MALHGRHFFITWNDDEKQSEKDIKWWNKQAKLVEKRCEQCENLRNFSGQVERGEDTNKFHLQIYLGFIRKVRRKPIDALLGTNAYHVEYAKGPKKAWNYCKKEETRVGYSFHSEWQDTNQGERTDIGRTLDNLRLVNGDTSQLGEDCEECYVKYHGGFDKIGKNIRNKIALGRSTDGGKRNVIIYWGEPGVGKTYRALKVHGATFVEFDGKHFEFDQTSDTVLIDEADKSPWRELPASGWLRMLDSYSYKMRVMYGHAIWNPKTIILTMNQNPEEWFFNRNEGLRRRVTQVIECDRSGLESKE